MKGPWTAMTAKTQGGEPSVALVTNQRLFRDALTLLIEPSRFRVIVEAATEHSQPETVIVDSSILDEGQIPSNLSKSYSCPIIVIVDRYDSSKLPALLEAGVHGVLDWSCSREFLNHALTRVIAGETVIGVSYATQVSAPVSLDVSQLTQRERQIIGELAAGKSNAEIGRSLGVTENTVKGHLVAIFEKLGMTNRVQVAAFAFENGLKSGSSDKVA